MEIRVYLLKYLLDLLDLRELSLDLGVYGLLGLFQIRLNLANEPYGLCHVWSERCFLFVSEICKEVSWVLRVEAVRKWDHPLILFDELC